MPDSLVFQIAMVTLACVAVDRHCLIRTIVWIPYGHVGVHGVMPPRTNLRVKPHC